MRQRSCRAGVGLVVAACVALFAAHAEAGEADSPFQRAIAAYAAAHPVVPGVAAAIVAQDGRLSWSGAVGLANRATGTKLDPAQQFRIASVTKPYTAAATLVLAERGKIRLEDPITRYASPETIAALRAGGYDPDVILVRHLLAHTSGIPDYAQSDAYRAAVMGDPTRAWTRAAQIEFALKHATKIGPPGAKFVYSDTGYIILGEILERETGQSLDGALRTLLAFDKHGLQHTRIERAGDSAAPDFAHAYLGSTDTAPMNPSFDLYGGGGLVSTVGDLARFMRDAYRGAFFQSPATLAYALAAVRTEQNERALYAHMGQALAIGSRVCWGHSGFWGVFAVYCPADDIAVAITFNVNDETTPLRPLVEALFAALPAPSEKQ